MAKTSAIAQGVTREDNFWGYSLTGTKEALLASGIAKEEWFWNGRRGADGRRLRTVYFKIDGNRAKCQPISWGNKDEYTIEVDYPIAEREERERRGAKDLAAHEAKEMLIHGISSLLIAFNVDSNPEKAWLFPASTVEQVDRHLREVDRLFKNGGFEIRSNPAVQSDVKFQRFMLRLRDDNPVDQQGDAA
jgi:hypothetical protein